MRSRLFFLVLLACQSSVPRSSPASLVVIPRPTAVAPIQITLPAPPAIPRAAIRVVGYPKAVSNGMNDPADVVGFTRDGSEYGYCATTGARDPGVTTCETRRRDGSSHFLSSDDDKGWSAKNDKALDEWIHDSGMPALTLSPLVGWEFSDIVVWVNPIPGDGTSKRAVIELGGAVDGERPVFPIVIDHKEDPFIANISIVNDLSLSRDGTEIGLVGLFFCGEWCNMFEVRRMSTRSLASLVYNESGFRRHKASQFARAAELFLKAADADPLAKLPAYNLACAWARLGDSHTRNALSVAIDRDPDARVRARTDADFSNVKNEFWFRELVK